MSKLVLSIDSSYYHGSVKEIQLQGLAKVICLDIYNCTKYPEVYIDEQHIIVPKENGGQYRNNIMTITRDKSNGVTMYYFFHEIRHFLQEYFRPNLYKYWSTYRGYSEYYDKIPIEIEATEYGQECVRQSGAWQSPTTFQRLETLDKVARRSLPVF